MPKTLYVVVALGLSPVFFDPYHYMLWSISQEVLKMQEWSQVIGLVALIAFFSAWGFLAGAKHYREKRPQTSIDKVGNVVLDYNHTNRSANIINRGAFSWRVDGDYGDYGTIIVVSANGNETRMEREEAHQLGRALQYVSWVKDTQ